MEFRTRLVRGKQEINAYGLRAQHFVPVIDADFDLNDVATLPTHGSPQNDMVISRVNRLVIADLHLRSNAARLKLPEYDPAADLVGQRCLNASVQRIHPTLLFGTRMPDAHDFIAVFVKFHPQSLRTVRIAAVAMVTVHAAPRIRYLLHNMLFDRCGADRICSVI